MLCSRRFIAGAACKGYKHVNKFTNRASLMGDPGTKALLTLTVLVAENMAWYEVKNSLRFFRSAGDDMFAIGDIVYLTTLMSCLQKMGAVINMEICYISTIGAFYCEEMILKLNGDNETYFAPRGKLPFWKKNRVFYELTVHIDGIKTKNLSRVTKVTMVKEEKNCAIGKVKQCQQIVSWLPYYYRTGFSDLIFRRLQMRLGKMIDWENVMTYLPRLVGGLEIPRPSFISDRTVYDSFFKLPVHLQSCICAAIYLGIEKLDIDSRRALRGYSSNRSYRGIQQSHLQEDYYKRIYKSSQFTFAGSERDNPGDPLLRHAIEHGLVEDSLEWRNLKFRVKCKKT
jgi:hypothetical protein